MNFLKAIFSKSQAKNASKVTVHISKGTNTSNVAVAPGTNLMDACNEETNADADIYGKFL